MNDALSFSLFCQPVLKNGPLEAQCCSALFFFFCHHNCLIHPLFIIDFWNNTVLHCQGTYWAMLLGRILIVPQKSEDKTHQSQKETNAQPTAHTPKLACTNTKTWPLEYALHKKAHFLIKKHLVHSQRSDRICVLQCKYLNMGFLDQTNVKLKEKAALFRKKMVNTGLVVVPSFLLWPLLH